MPGLGAEIVLSIDNELRRARFYWRTQVLEMLDIIASTESSLTSKGWRLEASRRMSLSTGIVQVGDGRGFVMEADRLGWIIVTSAHCLPRLPPPQKPSARISASAARS